MLGSSARLLSVSVSEQVAAAGLSHPWQTRQLCGLTQLRIGKQSLRFSELQVVSFVVRQAIRDWEGLAQIPTNKYTIACSCR